MYEFFSIISTCYISRLNVAEVVAKWSGKTYRKYSSHKSVIQFFLQIYCEVDNC